MRAVLALLGLLFMGSPASSAERTMNATDPVTAAARFKGPAGWQRDTGSFGADHFVTYSSGTLRLRVQLFGGKGSRYPSSKLFLAGPEAKGGDGKLPAGRVTKSGKGKLRIYERSYEVAVGAIGVSGPGASETVEELFAVIPAGKRFFVLSYTRRNEVPPETPLDPAPWTRFLSSFHPK